MKISKTTQDSSIVGALTAIEKDEEKADMKYLFRLIDLDLQQQQKLNILSAQQVHQYYTMIKHSSLREQEFSTKEEQETLINKAQQTLRVLMIALMLGGEHEIVKESYKKKLDVIGKGMTD